MSVTVHVNKGSTVTLTSPKSSVKIHTRVSKIVLSKAGTQGPPGIQGEPGVGSTQEIINIVKQTIHADATTTDGIEVDGTGNIRLAIGTLQTIP